jgi:hypothetical protein
MKLPMFIAPLPLPTLAACNDNVGQVFNLRPLGNRPGERSSPAREANRRPEPGSSRFVRSHLCRPAGVAL